MPLFSLIDAIISINIFVKFLVFGISVITNEAHDDYAPDYENDGDDVVRAANAAAEKMNLLFERIIGQL